MKKIILVISLTFASLILSSCASSGNDGDSSETVAVETNSNAKVYAVPDFVLTPPKAEGVLYGVGSSVINDKTANPVQLAMGYAEQSARANIAKQVSVKVETMMKQFNQQSGMQGDMLSSDFMQTVTKSFSTMEVKNGIIVKQEQLDGTWWVLVEYSKDSVNEAVQEKVANISSQELLQAQLARFQANDAFTNLADEVSKGQEGDGLAAFVADNPSEVGAE